jgi:hypothetical protein
VRRIPTTKPVTTSFDRSVHRVTVSTAVLYPVLFQRSASLFSTDAKALREPRNCIVFRA